MANIIYYIVVALLGLIAGSFLNVCIVRLPKEESVVVPRSHCPYCENTIRFYDNIPIFSYISLKGRCRACGLPISLRYPIVEALTASLFVLLAVSFKGFVLAAYIIFVCGVIVASFVDLEHEIIPDEVSLYGIIAGILLSVIFPSLQHVSTHMQGLRASLFGALVGAGLIYGIGILGKLIFRKESMGFGDVKFMAAIGSFLGPEKAVLVFFLAPCFGIIFGLIARIRYQKEYIPYGPFLSLAALACVFINVSLRDIFWRV